jgi:hypothetical protein
MNFNQIKYGRFKVFIDGISSFIWGTSTKNNWGDTTSKNWG